MKRLWTVAAIALVAVAGLTIGSCQFFGFLSPSWALEGSWMITAYPSDWTDETYDKLVFTDGVDGYQFKSPSGTVFESGPVENLTRTGFEYTIEQYDPDPAFVGNDNYAEYVLDGDELTVTWYADTSKSTSFGTTIATRE